jgi:hypothetical protein
MKIGTVATACLSLIGFYSWVSDLVSKAADMPEARMARAFPSLRVDSKIPSKERVPRPTLENALRSFADSEPGMVYLVVVGPKGAGKTTLVQHALAGRPGVIVVATGPKIFDPLGLQIVKKLGLSESALSVDLVNVLENLGREKLADGKQLVIVVEVDRATLSEATADAVLTIKKLSSDGKSCKAILVMSDANAAFQLPSDPDRQDFLWVGGMTLAEITMYLAARGKLQTESTATKVVAPEDAAANKELIARAYYAASAKPSFFEKLGKRLPAGANARDPAVLAAVKQAIHDAHLSATRDVKGLAGDNPTVPYAAIYRELLAACDVEEARRVELADSERAKLPPVTDVVGIADESLPGMPAAKFMGLQFKERHALHFHSDTDTFHFASAAHRHAAKEWIEAADAKAKSWWRWFGF